MSVVCSQKQLPTQLLLRWFTAPSFCILTAFLPGVFSHRRGPLLHFIIIIVGGAVQHVGSQFPNQGSNLCPLQWKRGRLNHWTTTEALCYTSVAASSKRITWQLKEPCIWLSCCGRQEGVNPQSHPQNPRCIPRTRQLWDPFWKGPWDTEAREIWRVSDTGAGAILMKPADGRSWTSLCGCITPEKPLVVAKALSCSSVAPRWLPHL